MKTTKIVPMERQQFDLEKIDYTKIENLQYRYRTTVFVTFDVERKFTF